MTEPRPTEREVATVVLPDGRAVALALHGDPDGRPLFLLHGTPASRLGHEFTDAPARARGVRVICPDRPGIGRSDPRPLRHIADYPDDVAAVADAFGYHRFAVLGYSGGGPYALACAAALPDRVTVAGGMAAAGPPDGPRGFDGLAPSDIRMLRLAQRRPRLAGAALRVATVVAARLPHLAVRSFASELGDSDRRKVEAEPPAMASFVESCRQGPAGAVLDYKLWAEPWGFSLAGIRVPVHLWQGDDDRMVPMHHAEWLAAQIPGAVVHPIAGAGHVSIQEHIGEMLDVLVPRLVP